MQANTPNRIYNGFLLISASNSNNFISMLLYGSEFASFDYGSQNSYLFRDYSVSGRNNTWYHMKWELIDGVLKYYVYNSNRGLLTNKSVELSSEYSNVEVYPSLVEYNYSGQINRFKNIKVKPL